MRPGERAAARPLTVLHVITQLGSGGAERMLTRVATHDFGPGAPRQAVISLMDKGVYGAALEAHGVELHCLGMRRGWASPRALFKAITLIRRVKPDLVMTWLYHADLLGTVAARLAGVRRVVWNLRGSEMAFGHYAPTTRWTASVLARMSRWPVAVAANSRAGRRAHEAMGYRPRRWVYLPNGFDLDEWRPDAGDRAAVRRELGFGESDVAIGVVARVDPQKDYTTLLDAAGRLISQVPEARFVLIGKGTQALAVPSPLRLRVEALGERRDVARLMRGLDMVALASAFGEGFPNAVGEAMASGLPCVVTDVGDAADLARGAGAVAPPGDPAALAEALAVLARLPPGERERRGLGARERIKRDYGIDEIAGRYLALWEDVAAT